MAINKVINSQSQEFQPVLTDTLVLDAVPTVNSFNSVTSDAVARAVAGASGEVPAVTESDNGKVLTAVYDEGGAAVEWADAQGGGAEYSAGTGISISAQDEISVDTTVIATKNDLSGYQPTISDLETIRSGASAGATAVQPGSLATVATSGSYNDLSNKPSIPAAQVNSDWTAASGVSQILNKPSLATVATSGSYADLSNKPTIPTVSDNVAKLQYGVATYAQVVAAFNAGKSIYLYTGDTDDGAVCSDITFGDDGGEIIFSRHNAYGSAGSRTEYKVTSSNAWSTTTKNVVVPTVDQSYSASSTNAQSGVAVAGALATINQLPSSTSADEDKVLTVNSSGNAVWATAQGGGSSYTAGDGIDISAQDEISVKAGNGLTIGDYSYEHTGTLNLTATPVLSQGSYHASYIAQLTPELLAQINSTNGLQVTLTGAYGGFGKDLYAGLAKGATNFSTDLSNYVVFGSSLGQSIAAGTTVTFNFADKEAGDSYATVAADVSSYYLVILYIVWGDHWGNDGCAAPSADPITTGTYTGTETVTVQNAVNLSTPIEVVAAMPANPTSGVLYIVTGA